MNAELQAKVLDGAEAITCRPADLLKPELESLKSELKELSKEHSIQLTDAEGEIDDVLTYALFPQIGLKYLQNRGNPNAFEPVPTGKESSVPTSETGEEIYTVEVDGTKHTVTVGNGGDITGWVPVSASSGNSNDPGSSAPTASGEPLPSPLAGNIFKVNVTPGQAVKSGDSLIVLEAMKMETNVSAPRDGTVTQVMVKTGDSVTVGDTLLAIA